MKNDDSAVGGDPVEPAPLDPEDRQLMAALLGSARLDVPPEDLEAQVIQGLARRRAAARSSWQSSVVTRRTALAAATLALAAAVVLWARRGPKTPALDVVAEPPALSSIAPVDVCAFRRHAAGGEPAIDDFEDGDGVIRPLEGRSGLWFEVRDSDPPGVSRPLLPSLRPEPTEGNRFALHVSGGELRDWGASTQLKFEPPCYDASTYAGVAFSARGPGRLYISASEVRVVPVEWGGTCTRDCYNTHARKIDLDGTWRRFEVRWSELHQRGYATAPLDPRSLHTLSFNVHAEDTPYDLWIDDVAFLTR